MLTGVVPAGQAPTVLAGGGGLGWAKVGAAEKPRAQAMRRAVRRRALVRMDERATSRARGMEGCLEIVLLVVAASA
jgi:hypothetical protein